MKKIPVISIRKSKKRIPTHLRGYDHAWKKASKDYRQANPICQVCKSVVATQVDHVLPLSQGGAKLDHANLQSICATCHALKTINDQELYR